MNIKERIDKDWLDARKKKDQEKATILGTIRSDAMFLAKTDKKGSREVTEADYAQALTSNFKGITGAVEESRAKGADESMLAEYMSSLKILEEYMPKNLSAKETETLIRELYDEGNHDMPSLMRALKASGQPVDMKLANGLVNTLLKEQQG